MPQPTAGDVHVDSILTGMSVANIQTADHFVATQVFQEIPGPNKSDEYFVFTKGDWFRDEAQRRPDSTPSAGGGYTLSTDNYRCDVWAFHKDIGNQTRQNADAPLNLDEEATRFVTQRLMLRQEIEWATSFFTAGVWATDTTPTTTWDGATADVISDIETGKTTILQNTGFEPNTLVLGYGVWQKLKHHPDIVDRYKHTTADAITEDMVARVVGLDRILVAKAVKNTGIEGSADSFGYVHGNHGLLCYVPPSPGLITPAAGYTFTWTGVSQGLGASIGVSRIPMAEIKSDRIEGEIAFDYKVVASDLGYFFQTAV